MQPHKQTRKSARRNTVTLQNLLIEGADGATNAVAKITVEVTAQIYKEEEMYLSFCPSLEVCTQGESYQEAKENIIEATQLLVESCAERGTLTSALLKRGFTKANRAERRKKVGPHSKKGAPKGRTVHFPLEIPLPLAA